MNPKTAAVLLTEVSKEYDDIDPRRDKRVVAALLAVGATMSAANLQRAVRTVGRSDSWKLLFDVARQQPEDPVMALIATTIGKRQELSARFFRHAFADGVGPQAAEFIITISKSPHLPSLIKRLAKLSKPSSELVRAIATTLGGKPTRAWLEEDLLDCCGLLGTLMKSGSPAASTRVLAIEAQLARLFVNSDTIDPGDIMARLRKGLGIAPKAQPQSQPVAKGQRPNPVVQLAQTQRFRAADKADWSAKIWLAKGEPNEWFGALQKNTQLLLELDAATKPYWEVTILTTNGKRRYNNVAGRVHHDDFALPPLDRLDAFPAWLKVAEKVLQTRFSTRTMKVSAGRLRSLVADLRSWLDSGAAPATGALTANPIRRDRKAAAQPTQREVIVGEITDWQLGPAVAKLLALPKHAQQIGCYQVIGGHWSAVQNAVFAQEESISKELQPHEDALHGALATCDAVRGTQLAGTRGFHANLNRTKLREALESKFTVITPAEALATRRSTGLKSAAAINRLMSKKTWGGGKRLQQAILAYLDGASIDTVLDRGSHNLDGLVGTVFVRGPECFNETDDRLFELWARAADDTSLPPMHFPATAYHELGADRFGAFRDKLVRLGMREEDAENYLLSQAETCRWWPSTGVWAWGRLRDDPVALCQRVLGLSARQHRGNAALANLLMAVCWLPEEVHTAVRTDLLEACASPELVPDEALEQLMADEDAALVLANLERKPSQRGRSGGKRQAVKIATNEPRPLLR